MLALEDMVDRDLFICPWCASPVPPEQGRWHCAEASCRYADDLDRFLDPGHSADAASSAFFLGRKTETISAADIIDYYQGGR